MADKQEHFDSLAEFAAASDARATDRRDRGGADDEWYGFASYIDALALARNGWQAGAERVKALADKIMQSIAPAVACVGLEHQAGGGSLVDVDRFVSGEPECFMEFAPAESRKHVTIEVNGGTGNQTPAANIERRGAAILAAVLALKARGITADIVWSVATGSYHKRRTASARDYIAQQTVMVCNGREWLDVESLAFALVHPAMLRHVALGTRDVLPKSWKMGQAHRYGCSIDAQQIPGAVYLPRMNKHDCATDAQALELALSLCARCGAEITQE